MGEQWDYALAHGDGDGIVYFVIWMLIIIVPLMGSILYLTGFGFTYLIQKIVECIKKCFYHVS